LGALFFLPLPTAAQTTQTLSLDEGWNLVSLRVQPDDPSFASIFGGTDGAISSVKNEDGAACLPALGIEQISTWQADEGYKVHAETATTIKIIGTDLSPGSIAIALEEGGNIVPYLPDRAQAVEEAVMSVEESLIAVENEDGRRYPSRSTSLDSLRPGQGYKVYVDRADTLRYPTVVKTLDDALALTGVPVGSQVRVQGYHEPGDGGGGLFRVTESGAETDGGTVFAFNEDVSAQQSEQLTDKVRGKSLPSKDLRWGTVQVEINGTSNERIVDTEFLHGHTMARWVSQGQHVPMINHKTGTFADRTILQSANNQLNGDNTFTARYKFVTTDRRLERTGIQNAVSIDWWGAKEADPQNPVNNWWRINWAINKAKEIYENGNYEWAYVDIPGHYYYRYLIRIQNGVRLRGTSGQTFAPAANGQPTRGKLTIMPGLAMNHQKDGFDQNHLHGYLNTAAIDLTHAQGIRKFGGVALELDGNRENNLAPVEDPNNNYTDVSGKLLSGANWNALAGKGQNNDAWNPADGARSVWEDIYAHDYPGNGFAPNGLDWTGSKNLRIENSFRNHQFYLRKSVGEMGEISGAQIEGWGWGSLIKVTKGTYTNIDITPTPNKIKEQYPSRWGGMDWEKVWDHHGKGFGVNWSKQSKINEMKIDVNTFSVDLSETNNTTPNRVIADRGYGGEYTGGTVLSDPQNLTTLIAPVSTAGNGPIRDYLYENIIITNQGGEVALRAGAAKSTHLTYKNITLKAGSGVSGLDDTNFFKMQQYGSYAEQDPNNNYPLGMAARVDLEGIDVQQPRSGPIFKVNEVQLDKHPYNIFVSGSTIENSADGGWKSENLLMDGSRTGIEKVADRIRLFMSNCTFNVYQPPPDYRPAKTHYFLQHEKKAIRLRNCTSPAGRVSDESGSYTSTTSDEGNAYVLIPTDLMSLAQAKSAAVTGGSRTVTSVENANASGTVQTWDPSNPQAFDPRDPYLKVNLDSAIQTGETITVDWTARVTPTADYQPTGVFVARSISDTSYTSGNGPFTVDLRGVAASQETQDPIKYSASSGDPSVAGATVNSTLSASRTEVPWELQLREQGTGTATITVTATIDGVGTATDTFEVTIE
jgi:hypothetical protein